MRTSGNSDDYKNIDKANLIVVGLPERYPNKKSIVGYPCYLISCDITISITFDKEINAI